MADYPAYEREGEDEAAAARLAAVRVAVEAGDAVVLAALLEPLHAADVADLLEQNGFSVAEAKDVMARLRSQNRM